MLARIPLAPRSLKNVGSYRIARQFSAMRVVLLQPPGSCKTFTRSQSVYPPLGLCQLAATVSEEVCHVLDAEGLNLTENETVRRVVDYRPACVGFTVTTMTMPLVNQYAAAIKNIDPTILIMAGGPQATAAPDTVLRECPSVDVVFRGEGEAVFPTIVNALDPTLAPVQSSSLSLEHRLSAISSLPGIVPRSQQDVARTIPVQRVPAEHFLGGNTSTTTTAASSNNPNNPSSAASSPALPFPVLDRMPLESYWSPDALRRPMVTFMTARGCPFQCAFCATPATIGRTVRGWDPAAVVQELARLSRLGIKEVSFVDDLFTAEPQRVKALCQGLIEHQVDITWFANTRADRVNPKLCALMKQAGCHQLFLGVESGSPKMLKYVKKGESPETMVRGADIIRNAGIRISAGFIIGLPGETDDTVDETIALAHRIQPDRIQFSRWTPLAGSALVEQPETFSINPLTAPALETYLQQQQQQQGARSVQQQQGNDNVSESVTTDKGGLSPLSVSVLSGSGAGSGAGSRGINGGGAVPDGGIVSGAGGFHGMQFRLKMMEASIRGNSNSITTSTTTTTANDSKAPISVVTASKSAMQGGAGAAPHLHQHHPTAHHLQSQQQTRLLSSSMAAAAAAAGGDEQHEQQEEEQLVEEVVEEVVEEIKEDRVDRWIRKCYTACGAKRTGEVDWGKPSI